MNALTTTQATETLDTIYQRRAIRKYKDKAVSKDLIDEILDAGRMAPSAINQQAWKFYILTDKKQIQAISGEIGQKAQEFFHLAHGIDTALSEDFIFHGAPVVILLTAPKNNEWAALDTGMCAQNMMLAAKSLGLDTCPIGLAKFIEQTNAYKGLKIPQSESVLLAIILGYGDEHTEPKDRKNDNAFFL